MDISLTDLNQQIQEFAVGEKCSPDFPTLLALKSIYVVASIFVAVTFILCFPQFICLGSGNLRQAPPI